MNNIEQIEEVIAVIASGIDRDTAINNHLKQSDIQLGGQPINTRPAH